VAPYLNEDTERKYFLPKGEWKALWTGQIFKGCDCQRVWKEVLPAVFIRSSSPFATDILEKVGVLVNKYQDVLLGLPDKNS
jgi:alpha-glucosidase (family GH31 glycosyl hydrolase)